MEIFRRIKIKRIIFAAAFGWNVMTIILNTSCKQDHKDTSGSDFIAKTDLTAISELIVKDPSNADLYFQRAQIFEAKKNLKQAYDDAVKAVSIDSTKYDYYMLLADISFKGLLIQKAIPAFEKAISLQPDNQEGHLKMSELMLYLKAYPKCLSEANEALRINKNIPKAYFLKGFAYKETGDTAKAVSSFLTTVELQPEYYDAYIQLGNIEAKRKHKICIQYYSNALRLQPNSTEALYDRGLAFQNMGQTDFAISDYNHIVKIDPDYAQAYFNLGYIDLVIRQNYDSSIVFFTNAVKAEPEYAEAYFNRGMAHKLSGRKKEAEKDFRKAISIVPTYSLALKELKKINQ